jgi:hypothetical protein
MSRTAVCTLAVNYPQEALCLRAGKVEVEVNAVSFAGFQTE